MGLDEGVVLVDTKMAPDHDGVVEFVRSVTDAPIKYVIDTHMHPDHVGGNPPLKAIGAEIISSANARRIMVEREQPGLPDITLDDHVRVWLDDMPIEPVVVNINVPDAPIEEFGTWRYARVGERPPRSMAAAASSS